MVMIDDCHELQYTETTRLKMRMMMMMMMMMMTPEEVEPKETNKLLASVCCDNEHRHRHRSAAARCEPAASGDDISGRQLAAVSSASSWCSSSTCNKCLEDATASLRQQAQPPAPAPIQLVVVVVQRSEKKGEAAAAAAAVAGETTQLTDRKFDHKVVGVGNNSVGDGDDDDKLASAVGGGRAAAAGGGANVEVRQTDRDAYDDDEREQRQQVAKHSATAMKRLSSNIHDSAAANHNNDHDHDDDHDTRTNNTLDYSDNNTDRVAANELSCRNCHNQGEGDDDDDAIAIAVAIANQMTGNAVCATNKGADQLNHRQDHPRSGSLGRRRQHNHWQRVRCRQICDRRQPPPLITITTTTSTKKIFSYGDDRGDEVKKWLDGANWTFRLKQLKQQQQPTQPQEHKSKTLINYDTASIGDKSETIISMLANSPQAADATTATTTTTTTRTNYCNHRPGQINKFNYMSNDDGYVDSDQHRHLHYEIRGAHNQPPLNNIISKENSAAAAAATDDNHYDDSDSNNNNNNNSKELRNTTISEFNYIPNERRRQQQPDLNSEWHQQQQEAPRFNSLNLNELELAHQEQLKLCHCYSIANHSTTRTAAATTTTSSTITANNTTTSPQTDHRHNYQQLNHHHHHQPPPQHRTGERDRREACRLLNSSGVSLASSSSTTAATITTPTPTPTSISSCSSCPSPSCCSTSSAASSSSSSSTLVSESDRNIRNITTPTETISGGFDLLTTITTTTPEPQSQERGQQQHYDEDDDDDDYNNDEPQVVVATMNSTSGSTQNKKPILQQQPPGQFNQLTQQQQQHSPSPTTLLSQVVVESSQQFQQQQLLIPMPKCYPNNTLLEDLTRCHPDVTCLFPSATRASQRTKEIFKSCFKLPASKRATREAAAATTTTKTSLVDENNNKTQVTIDSPKQHIAISVVDERQLKVRIEGDNNNNNGRDGAAAAARGVDEADGDVSGKQQGPRQEEQQVRDKRQTPQTSNQPQLEQQQQQQQQCRRRRPRPRRRSKKINYHIPQSILRTNSSLRTDDYDRALSVLSSDIRFKLHLLLYRRCQFIWTLITTILCILVPTLLLAQLQFVIIVGACSAWLGLQLIGVLLTTQTRKKLDQMLEKSVAQANSFFMDHNLMLGVINVGGLFTKTRLLIPMLYFDTSQCREQIESIISIDLRQDADEIKDKQEQKQLQNQQQHHQQQPALDYSKIDLSLTKPNVMALAQSQLAKKIVLRYSQRWISYFDRRKLMFNDDKVRPRHLSTGKCLCQFVEEHFRNNKLEARNELDEEEKELHNQEMERLNSININTSQQLSNYNNNIDQIRVQSAINCTDDDQKDLIVGNKSRNGIFTRNNNNNNNHLTTLSHVVDMQHQLETNSDDYSDHNDDDDNDVDDIDSLDQTNLANERATNSTSPVTDVSSDADPSSDCDYLSNEDLIKKLRFILELRKNDLNGAGGGALNGSFEDNHQRQHRHALFNGYKQHPTSIILNGNADDDVAMFSSRSSPRAIGGHQNGHLPQSQKHKTLGKVALLTPTSLKTSIVGKNKFFSHNNDGVFSFAKGVGGGAISKRQQQRQASSNQVNNIKQVLEIC